MPDQVLFCGSENSTSTWTKVDTVLLTHLHIDHSGDLPAFFNARALTSDGPIIYRVFGPDGAGLFPKTSRFVDLLVGEDGAFAYQKTFGAPETFTVRDLAISLDSAQTKIVDEDGLVVEEIATHHGDCPSVAYRISYKGAVRRLLRGHGCVSAAEPGAIGEECGPADL